MCHHNAGGIWKGRHGVGWVEGCERSPFDVCPGRVMPVCLAHGSGDSMGLHNLLLERPGLKRETPCGAQWMVAYLADSRLCSGPGAKRMAGSEEKGLGGRGESAHELGWYHLLFPLEPHFLQPLVSPHSPTWMDIWNKHRLYVLQKWLALKVSDLK